MKKNSKAKNRRSQNHKPAKSGNYEPIRSANADYVEAMQGLRRSSATSRHKSAADYSRRPKHMGKGWDQ